MLLRKELVSKIDKDKVNLHNNNNNTYSKNHDINNEDNPNRDQPKTHKPLNQSNKSLTTESDQTSLNPLTP